MSQSRRPRLNAVALVALVLSALPVLALTAPAAQGAAPSALGASSLWTRSAQKPQASLNGHRRSVNPSSYKAYSLNKTAMTALLAAAPLEDTAAARRGGATTVTVPAPTGELIDFAVVESPVMEDELQAANPLIRTYAGNSVTDGYTASIRLDQTLLGFHASVIEPDKSSWFVDPAYIGDTSLYLSYDKDALPNDEGLAYEKVLDPTTKREITEAGAKARAAEPRVGAAGAVVTRREYRLALVSDDSYALEFGATGADATSDPLVLSAKTTLMNRVNQIYNNDLAVKMLLVNGTNKLNFQTQAEGTGANGPCGAAACYASTDFDGCGDVIDTNTHVLGKLIGAENYDIGHIVFGADGDGGGVAYLGAVGEDDIKGGGCTGLAPPKGDGFAIDYVAHEMGHEFAGNHTFNGSNGSCGGNGEPSASVEPGSGITVMAYAGICAQDDLQPHSDPYFSQKSQDEITAHITGAISTFNEVQEFGLGGFTSGEGFKLDFNGTQTAEIKSGTNYTVAGIKAAVEPVTGATVTASAVSASGFTLTYTGAKAGTNIVNPTIVVTTGSFTGVGGDYIKGGPSTNQGTPTVTANHNPTVTAPALGTKTIPYHTPFTLTGSGVDSDGGDTLTYLWEQNNAGTGAGTLGAHLKGPLFRVFGKYANVTASTVYNSANENLAGTDPSRTFPDIEQIVANQTNAETSCAALTETSALPDNAKLRCHSEYLPDATYQSLNGGGMVFRLTARDSVATGGGTDFKQVTVNVSPTIGPFLVTAPNTAVSWAGNSTQTVTWSNTTSSLSPNVKISLSTDGGLTYPTVLLASTPNDGTQAVTIPNTATTTARIKVEAVENYFFDISNTNFTITSAAPVGLQVTQPGNPTQSVQYSDAIASVGFSATSDNAGANLAASIDPATPLPAGLTLSARTGSNTAASWTITGATTAAPGVYNVTAKVADGTQTTNVPLTFTITQESATPTYTGPTTAQAPSNGTGVVSVPLTATISQQADGNLGDLTTATATFLDTTTGNTLCSSPVAADGTAGCSFNADSPKTYAVKVNVGGRFTGTTASDTNLVVATIAPAGLVVTQPDNPSQSKQYSDAIAPVVTSATTDRVGGVLAMSIDAATPLPTGVTLSARSGSDSNAFWTISGTANAAPGVYNVTGKVTDGTQTTDVPLTFTVTQESATPTYTGPTTAAAAPGSDHVNVDLTATVAQQADGSLGDLANATATFVDTTTSTTLCTSPVTSGGAAGCTFNAAAPATYHVKVDVGGRFSGSTASDTTLTTSVLNGLQVTQPANPTQSLQYSDPLAEAIEISATTDRPSGVLAASVAPGTPLPGGLSLSARGGNDTSAFWTVTGSADAPPAVYNVTIKVTDGTQTTDVPLTFTVTQENATPTYTGPTTAGAPSSGAGVVSVNLTATVGEAADGSLGDLANATATFVDNTSGDTLCSSPVTSGGTAGCSFNADSPRTYAVKVNVGGRYTGTTASNTDLVVSTSPTPVPDTTITSPPITWLLDTVAAFSFQSTLSGSTFTCTFDASSQACTPPFTRSGITTGTHVFTVAATKAGQTDPTPARTVTTVPVDDPALKDKKGVWLRKHNRGSFMKTFSSVHKKPGATLTYKVKNARSLALVATTGQKAGSVKVYLGSTLLKTVNLKGAKKNKVVFELGTFLSPTSGKLRIVVQTRKPVRIDGLGVATQL